MLFTSRPIQFLKVAAVSLAGAVMTACFYSGGDFDDSSSPSSAQFVDSFVIGISYETSSGLKGTTDEEGTFEYREGDSITFSLGGIVLPSGVPSDGYITPAHLAGRVDWEDSVIAINIIQLLMSLDEDQDASNGIQIDNERVSALEDFIDGDEFLFSDNRGFDSYLGEFFEGLEGLEYIDEEAAIEHFSDTLEDLNITIKIASGPCNDGNTAGIQGYWYSELSGAITDEVYFVIEGTEFDSEDLDVTISSCTFADASVKVLDSTTYIYNWVWLDGTDTYTFTLTDGARTLSVVEGQDVSSGSVYVD